MRKKPNLIPRMERCSHVQIKEPSDLRGRWLDNNNFNQLFLEIGCGKGKFTLETAQSVPDVLYVAVERVPDAMVIAMERVCNAPLENVWFIDMDASKLSDIFTEGELDRIYINFCDPWPSKKHAKRRLTAPGFLAIYKTLLKPGGEIHFKTDNSPLFEYSVDTFEENGWLLTEVTRNLHEKGICGIMTDYEEKFHTQGVAINRLVATFTGEKE